MARLQKLTMIKPHLAAVDCACEMLRHRQTSFGLYLSGRFALVMISLHVCGLIAVAVHRVIDA